MRAGAAGWPFGASGLPASLSFVVGPLTMLAALKRFFAADPNKPSVTMRRGQVFQWRRGFRLRATEDTQLALPGELVREQEQIGSIVEVDDDAQIGFRQRADGSFDAIILQLRAGRRVLLHRASDALLIADDDRERVFYVESQNAA
jgi:hypothetical protein